MRPGLAFRIGSVTKSFTATVVLQLVAERRLRLEDRVGRWLPGILPYGGSVTIHDLLQHTSGVPDYWEADRTRSTSRSSTTPARGHGRTPRRRVARVAGEPPDSGADTNRCVIVAAATGKPLSWHVEHRVIRPLGLRDTRSPSRAGRSRDRSRAATHCCSTPTGSRPTGR